ncbi:MAG: hypothetical protein ACRC0X_07220 [Brevinema sp.]
MIALIRQVIEQYKGEKQLFNPSLHTITNSNGEPASYAIDLRESEVSKLLSSKHNETKKGRAYDGSSDGEPHYHLTIKL